MQCCWVNVHAIQKAVSKMLQISLMLHICPMHKLNCKSHLLCLFVICYVGIEVPIFSSNLSDETPVYYSDTNFVQHLNMHQESLMVCLQIHIFALLEIIEFLFHISQDICKLMLLFKGVHNCLCHLQ
jgi:hypothetical protein